MKKISVLLIVLLILTISTGVFAKEKNSVVNDTETTKVHYNKLADKSEDLATLHNAKEITIKQKVISAKKLYEVFVDDKKVAELEGTLISSLTNLFGSKLTMKDTEGNFIVKEEPADTPQWMVGIEKAAAIKDKSGKTLGYIGEEIKDKLFSVGYYFHFYNQNNKKIGVSDESNLTVLKEGKFYGTDEELDYKVEKKFNLLTDEYVLKIKDKESEIPVEHAILMICIEDAIADSND